MRDLIEAIKGLFTFIMAMLVLVAMVVLGALAVGPECVDGPRCEQIQQD